MIIANQKQPFFRTFQEKIENPTFTTPRRLECSAHRNKKAFIHCVICNEELSNGFKNRDNKMVKDFQLCHHGVDI
jgi:hypothetical protein